MTNEDVDSLLTEPAIVFGSLPPGNRDLDLLVGGHERRRMQSELAARGWTVCGNSAAVFGSGTAFAVDVVDLDAWAPTPDAASALRAAALPLDGFTHLRQPAAHHRLLVLAVRHRSGMQLSEARRALIAGFSPGDWQQAEREAPSWSAGDALRELRAALGSRVDGPQRTRRRLHRPRRRLVIALSGLDGAGKSTHGNHLERALTALGYDATVQWTKLARDPVLDVIARPAKRVLARLGPRVEPERAPVVVDDEERRHPDGPRPPRSAASRRREASAVLTWGWSVVVATANAITHRRATAPAPRVVIADRYVLDSITHLRYRYAVARRFALQRAVLRTVSPRPVAAFLLDVQPAVARRRKPEQYTTADLTAMRALYHDEARRLDVVLVDADADEHEVAATLARITWVRLRGERRDETTGRASRRLGGGGR